MELGGDSIEIVRVEVAEDIWNLFTFPKTETGDLLKAHALDGITTLDDLIRLRKDMTNIVATLGRYITERKRYSAQIIPLKPD
jgi:hypothetical protein